MNSNCEIKQAIAFAPSKRFERFVAKWKVGDVNYGAFSPVFDPKTDKQSEIEKILKEFLIEIRKKGGDVNWKQQHQFRNAPKSATE